MSRALSFLILFLLSSVPAFAQSPDEIKFNKKQADRLHGFAEKAFKKGFPTKARRVWLMLLSEYDVDHAKARKALGYDKVGRSWGLNPRFVYFKLAHQQPLGANRAGQNCRRPATNRFFKTVHPIEDAAAWF